LFFFLSSTRHLLQTSEGRKIKNGRIIGVALGQELVEATTKSFDNLQHAQIQFVAVTESTSLLRCD
jgi:hypothetical protein